MGVTLYKTLYERFTGRVKSYELENLFAKSELMYESVLKEYLIEGRSRFKQYKSIDNKRLIFYIDDVLEQFNTDLNDDEQEILVKLMVRGWFSREILDLRSLRALLKSDFERISEANTLRAYEFKLEGIDSEIDKLISDYTWYDYMDKK